VAHLRLKIAVSLTNLITCLNTLAPGFSPNYLIEKPEYCLTPLLCCVYSLTKAWRGSLRSCG